MITLRDALLWDRVYANFCMYSLFYHDVEDNIIDFSFPGGIPVREVRPFELIDDAGLLGGRRLFVYDIRLSHIPDRLEECLSLWLSRSLDKQAICAWFQFEGGFNFERLLHPDDAESVYAIALSSVKRLAIDDATRSSAPWRSFIESTRRAIGF